MYLQECIFRNVSSELNNSATDNILSAIEIHNRKSKKGVNLNRMKIENLDQRIRFCENQIKEIKNEIKKLQESSSELKQNMKKITSSLNMDAGFDV